MGYDFKWVPVLVGNGNQHLRRASNAQLKWAVINTVIVYVYIHPYMDTANSLTIDKVNSYTLYNKGYLTHYNNDYYDNNNDYYEPYNIWSNMYMIYTHTKNTHKKHTHIIYDIYI